MKKIVFGLVFIFTLSNLGCESNQIYTNREEDKEEAQKFVEQFYILLQNKEYESATKLFSVGDATKEDVLRVFFKLDSALGKMTEYNLEDIKTEVKDSEGVKTGKYDLRYQATHQKGICRHEIVLEIIKDSLKITGYHPIIDL